MNPSQTGVVSLGSRLQRTGWMKEGILQNRSKSVFDGLTGNTKDAVVMQASLADEESGHEVTFDMDGNASGAGVVDKEQLWGNEEDKRKFSDFIRARRIRWGLNNGDKFDEKDIGDLRLGEHAHSRTLLSDLYVRQKDQMCFDAASGFLEGNAASHVIRPNDRATVGDLVAGDKAGYDFMMDTEEIIKTGRGFTVGENRRPIEPVELADGKRMWLWFVDARVARDLRKDTNFVAINQNADVRGKDNRLIKGVIGTYGAFMVVEQMDFYGKSASRTIGKSQVEIQGLRKLDSNDLYNGETGYAASGAIVASRSLIMGAGALQVGFSRQPDYKFKSSQDYDITSGSALEVWMNVQKTVLKDENHDYVDAKVSGFDYGVVCVDTFHSVIA